MNDQTIKAYANYHGYSDAHPYEVVRVVSPQTVEIRAMRASEKPWKAVWHKGGFAGHCSNQRDQEWEIVSDESFPVERIRWSKQRGGRWQDKYGRRFIMSDSPSRFHDYNF
jgi:hypothetical protein